MKLVQDPVLSLVRKARNARLRSVHTNVVLRRRMEQAVISQGVAPGRVRIIHKWAYATAIRATPPDPNGLRSASALNWRFVVGYSGDFGRAHEFNTILDAAELLHGDHRVAFLFISGRATCQLVEEEARRRALSNVQRRPYQPRKLFITSLGAPHVHLVSLNPELDGLIVPGKFYGIPTEARATVIVSVEGESPSILRKAERGYAVGIGKVVGSVQVLLDCRRSALCARLGANTRKAFDQQFERGIARQAWKEDLLAAANASPRPKE